MTLERHLPAPVRLETRNEFAVQIKRFYPCGTRIRMLAMILTGVSLVAATAQAGSEFDFARAFGCPVNVINDAAMQGLGSYKGGKMLFLGLGTGLGTALVVDGIVAPMEIGHLPYEKRTYEDYVGRAGLERHGKKKWRRHVADVVERLIAALQPDDTVIGGGNVTKLQAAPPHCRMGDNAHAFRGGFALWAKTDTTSPNLQRNRARTKRKNSHPNKAADTSWRGKRAKRS